MKYLAKLNADANMIKWVIDGLHHTPIGDVDAIIERVARLQNLLGDYRRNLIALKNSGHASDRPKS